MARYVREDYEPHFDRSGTTRRVLGHITDEDHVGRGPRNTTERLAVELAEDPNTRIFPASTAGDATDEHEGIEAYDPATVVQEHLDELLAAGLIAARDDGAYEVTEAGRVELVN